MQSYITGAQIASSIMMQKSQNRNLCFVVVEGRTDSVGYSWLLNKKKCKPVVAHRKENVLESVRILNAKSIPGVVGIVDSDFWNIEKVSPPSHNILATDTHDIETLIIDSPALYKMLSTCGDESKLSDDVIRVVIEAAMPLAYLRWISHKSTQFKLNFKNLDFGKFVDESTLKVDIDALVREVIQNTKKCAIDHEQLVKMLMTRLRGSRLDAWQICNGHDIVQILSIALIKMFGNYGYLVKATSISKWLTLAYEGADFCQTKLYGSIVNWEQLNNPYIVISDNYRKEHYQSRFNKSRKHFVKIRKGLKLRLKSLR